MRAMESATEFPSNPIVATVDRDLDATGPNDLTWRALSRTTQLYLGIVIAAGVWTLVAWFPTTYPHPAVFAVLLVVSCLTSTLKVNLPISFASGSTLSMSYAANLMSLILLGPRPAVVVGVAGAWTQCT